MTTVIPQKIICAAIRNKDKSIICGARHYDEVMHKQIKSSSECWFPGTVEQGFIDQRCNFLTREEAYVIAKEAQQIVRRCGGDMVDGKGRLFSENLY